MKGDKRLRIVMICNFSTKEIRNHLKLSDRRIINVIRKLLHKQSLTYYDFAPWIPSLISHLTLRQEIDLHVVAPHNGMIREVEQFGIDGVSYHFFNNRPTSISVFIDRKLFRQKLIKYKSNRRRVLRFIDDIKPDLVVLVGAENPYYSSTILSLQGYPVFILCQTIINTPDYLKSASSFQKNAFVEKQLFDRTNYVGVYSDMHYKMLRNLGYTGYIFDYKWPFQLPIDKDGYKQHKDYDFVNFASFMSMNKGYHDSVKALAIVKNKYPFVKMALVDHGPQPVKDELLALIKSLHLESNIDFIPFFDTKTDLYVFLRKVRFAVLPCKLDYTAGTMSDSLSHGLPLIVYRTEGTPNYNKNNNKTVLIAEMNNVEQLAEHMLSLMEDDKLAEELRENGFKYMDEVFKDRMDNLDRLVDDFYAIVRHFNDHANISPDLILK